MASVLWYLAVAMGILVIWTGEPVFLLPQITSACGAITMACIERMETE